MDRLLSALSDAFLNTAGYSAGLLALVSTAVVVAGLICEYFGAQSDARASWYPLTGGPPQYWDTERIGDLLIILGVIGELLFGVATLVFTTRLDTNRQTQIAQLKNGTAKAEQRAAEAELALERFREPRRLNLVTFPKYLRDKPKATAIILADKNDSEAWDFAWTLGFLLKDAGWDPSSWPSAPLPIPFGSPQANQFLKGSLEISSYIEALDATSRGVTIFSNDFERDFFASEKTSAMQALSEALGKSKIENVITGENKKVPNGTLLIVVGAKP